MNKENQGFGSTRGFTLLEIMVVMIIASLMIALVPPLFSAAVSGTQLKGSVRDLAIVMRETRSKAIITNTEQLVHLDLEASHYRVGNGKALTLPDDAVIAIQLITGTYVPKETLKHVVRFFPDGSSSGELITLSSGNNRYHLQLDWLTGNVRMRPDWTSQRGKSPRPWPSFSAAGCRWIGTG